MMMTSVTNMSIEAWDTLANRDEERATMVDKGETNQTAQVQPLDRDALSAVYDEYHPLVYKYIYRRVGDIEIARDLAAEVFRRLIQAVHKGAGPTENIRAWLFRVSHNIVIDHYRRRSNDQHLPVNDEIAGDNPDPERSVEKNRQLADVRRALRFLTPDQQQVLALKFLEGLSNNEVAEITGKTVGAVKALQHRALTSLQRRLARFDEEVQG